MTSTTTSTTQQYKCNIIQRIGGEADFKFVINSFVDYLKTDRKLEKFFSTFDDNDLAAYQEQFLKNVFSEKIKDNDVQNFIYLRYHRLFSQGFDEHHFDLLVSHFVASLRDAWIDDEELIGDAVRLLNGVRPIFEVKLRRSSFRRPLSNESLINAW